jgi:hypothetical protein
MFERIGWYGTRAIQTVFVVVVVLLLFAHPLHAQEMRPDTDGDEIPDIWETTAFHTDPTKKDTDGDSHDDRTEIVHQFNPLGSGPWEQEDGDADHDGLVDRLELLFGSDLLVADTDGDGFTDGVEIDTGYSPTTSSRVLLSKEIWIDLSEQKLEQRLGGIAIQASIVSTGKPGMRTPVGDFTVLAKHKRAWSRSAKLWMPWWMQFTTRGHGLHELPEWPGGKKEGANHLGKPVSHGCVRLGVGSAEELYAWAPVGTKIHIVP